MLRSPPADRSSKAALNLLESRLYSVTLLAGRTKRYHRSRFTDSLHHGRCSSTWDFSTPSLPAQGSSAQLRFATSSGTFPVAALPASVHAIAGYGGRSARLRHAVCRPRFLKGVIVRAVWCELQKGSGGWAKARLLLSTNPPCPPWPSSRHTPELELLSLCSVILKQLMAWEPCGGAAARPAALAPPRPDRPHPAGPADRKGRAANPRPDPPRRLATGAP